MDSKVKTRFRKWLKWLAGFVVATGVFRLLTDNSKYASPGFYGHLAIPGKFLIAKLMPYCGAGLAIMLLTAVVRSCLAPLMIGNAHRGSVASVAGKAYRPQIRKLKSRMKKARRERDKAGFHSAQKSLIHFYSSHGIGLASISFGSILIQIPVFAGLYAAVRFSPEIQRSAFLGVRLGKPSVAVAFVCFVLYAVMESVSLYGSRHPIIGEPSKGTDLKIEISFCAFEPIWIGTIAMKVAAGSALYFCVGGIFVILQLLYIRYKQPDYLSEGLAKRNRIRKELKN